MEAIDQEHPTRYKYSQVCPTSSPIINSFYSSISKISAPHNMSSTLKVVSLGGTASSVRVAGIGYGLMMMTWTPAPTPDEQAFEAIKTAIEQVPEGSKLLINSGT